jgi:hypothetical protein
MNTISFLAYTLFYSFMDTFKLLNRGDAHPTNSYFPLENHILKVKK